MLYGGHVRSFEHVDQLRDLGFDFGELVLPNSKAREFWRESGVRSRFDSGFFLVAHGPQEGPPNDIEHLRNKYLPALQDTILTLEIMEIEFLTVHCYMDSRFVKPETVEQKICALKEIVAFGRDHGVTIGLENLSEPAADLAAPLSEIPGLTLTLDLGHAQLLSKTNRSYEIIEKLGSSIRHVHLHDNLGGKGPADDLHLPVGEGIVDFAGILGKLVASGYDGTMTLELKPEQLVASKYRVRAIIGGLRR